MKNVKLAVLASGVGTNFEAIVKASREGRLAADVAGLISNRKKVGAIGRSDLLQVPRKVLSPKDFGSHFDWDKALVRQLEVWKVDWVVLAGFLVRIGPAMLKRYPHRIINSHPALLPKFGGAGMYGDFVHRAVLEAGEKESGVTIHTIDDQYDRGKILAQARVTISEGETPSSLSDKVKAAEVLFYPKVLNDLVTGRITTS